MTHLLAASEPGNYLHWGVILISVANLVVIALMVVVFLVAIWVPLGHEPAPRPSVVPSDKEPRS